MEWGLFGRHWHVRNVQNLALIIIKISENSSTSILYPGIILFKTEYAPAAFAPASQNVRRVQSEYFHIKFGSSTYIYCEFRFPGFEGNMMKR
jgi:hypothetical protein